MIQPRKATQPMNILLFSTPLDQAEDQDLPA